jgi:Smg protein
MFDILVFVFENCRQADVSHDPERVARRLSAAGFDDMEISAALS